MYIETIRSDVHKLLDRWLDGEISSTEFIAILSSKMVEVNNETNRCEQWLPFDDYRYPKRS